jgi:hypothetical protein
MNQETRHVAGSIPVSFAALKTAEKGHSREKAAGFITSFRERNLPRVQTRDARR